jgi:hypothetical protein
MPAIGATEELIEQQRAIGAEAVKTLLAHETCGIAADNIPYRCRDRRERECHADVEIECSRKIMG